MLGLCDLLAGAGIGMKAYIDAHKGSYGCAYSGLCVRACMHAHCTGLHAGFFELALLIATSSNSCMLLLMRWHHNVSWLCLSQIKAELPLPSPLSKQDFRSQHLPFLFLCNP